VKVKIQDQAYSDDDIKPAHNMHIILVNTCGWVFSIARNFMRIVCACVCHREYTIALPRNYLTFFNSANQFKSQFRPFRADFSGIQNGIKSVSVFLSSSSPHSHLYVLNSLTASPNNALSQLKYLKI